MSLAFVRRVAFVGLLAATTYAVAKESNPVERLHITVHGCVDVIDTTNDAPDPIHENRYKHSHKRVADASITGRDTVFSRLPCRWRQFTFGLICVVAGVFIGALIHASYVAGRAEQTKSSRLRNFAGETCSL